MFSYLKSHYRSISKEVTLGLIFTVAVVSSIALVISYGLAAKRAESQLEEKADEYIAFLKNILVVPMWNYDFETIEAVGQTYLQNDFIAGINIADSRGFIQMESQIPDESTSFVRVAQLYHHGLPIGQVKIALTSGHLIQLNRQFLWSLCLTIFINLLSLIIMTGLLLRWSLKKPLGQLDEIVNSYAAGDYQPFNREMPYIELQPLVETINKMGEQIEFQLTEIQKAEKKYRSIFENAIEGIFQSTPDGHIISANPAFAQILDYDSPEELMDTITDIGQQHYVDLNQREEFIRQLKQNGVISSFEVRLYRKDMSTIWVSINARPIYDSKGQLLHFEGLVQDITQRKKTETQLQQLSTAVEQAAENIMITDGQGRIAYVNPSFERSSGYSKAELINKDPRLLYTDENNAEIYDDIWGAATRGKTWTGRITRKKKDGEAIIEDVTVSSIKSQTGRFLGYVSVNRDVTEKVKIENQLRQAQKMEAIGTLAGGIAHDFNNILGVIIGCSELALSNLSKDHSSGADIEKVLEAGLGAKSLVRQILTFSRQSKSESLPLILQPFLKEVTKFLRASLPATIDIQLSIDTPNGVVLADPIQIQQILMNLCSNSSHAMSPDGGKLFITLSDAKVSDAETAQLPDLKPGNYLKLTVRDTGSGIPEDCIHRIFDPFFTTKKISEGTGLGLSVVHGIVKKHDGAVLVDSIPGQGAIFDVFLPKLEHPDIKIVAEHVSDLPKGTEQILLVDDEAILADILHRILTGLGYGVYTHTSSIKALEMFLENPDRFELVIVDHTMPELTGTMFAGEIRKIRPKLPIILCTGLNDKHAEEEANKAKISRMLIKPIRRDELALVIREVLDDYGKTTD
jgi:PAS domain S-box-containing protein